MSAIVLEQFLISVIRKICTAKLKLRFLGKEHGSTQTRTQIKTMIVSPTVRLPRLG